MDHDAAYKRLFSHRRMVRSFLDSFVPEPAARLDLSILEPLPAAFLADAGFRRRGDVVWRAGVAGDPSLTALVLFEFQSRPDARMVQRMEVYKALCLDAAARHPWGKDVGRLRLVPVVVYNGARKWTAPLDAPPVWTGAGQAAPRPSYRMVDLDALLEYDPAGADVAGALVGLERARTLGEFRAEAATLARLLSQPGDVAMAQAFSSWIAELMNKCGLRVQSPATTQLLTGGEPMIAETMKRWTQEWWQQGKNEGLQQGRNEGLRQGRNEGLRQGRNEGLQQGLEEQKVLLRQQAERKFGPEAAAAMDRLLEPMADPARLRAVGEAIVDCDAADELLNRVR